MRNALLVVAAILVAALAAGCGGRSAQPPAQPEQPAAQPSPGAPGAAPAGGTVVTIVGKDNLYEPATVEVKAGQEYEFHFKNVGTTVHNVIVNSKDAAGQDFASDIAVNAGQESVFKVKIDKAGTYKLTCTYHPEMVGELKVGP